MELTTCLWFDGCAREAAIFYTSIFPDSEIADHWLAPTDTPGNKQGEEVVVHFKIFGQNFIGLNGGPMFPHSEAISFQIPCADQNEIDKYWDLLIKDGGQESQCGWLKDKFGVSWQVTSPEMMQYLGGSDPEGAQRATQAMLGMKKIDLAAMKKAYLKNKSILLYTSVMVWIFLGIAIAAEIMGTLFLKASDGLSKLLPTVGVAVGFLTAFALMSQSLKKLDVGIAYAIWSGVGIVGAAIGGYLFFDQQLNKVTIIGMLIIVIGVVVMNLGGASH